MEIKSENEITTTSKFLTTYQVLKKTYLGFRDEIEKFISDNPELFYLNFPESFDANAKSGLKITTSTLQERILHFYQKFQEIEKNIQTLESCGIEAKDYKSFIFSVNAFCMHVLYIFMNITDDVFDIFQKLGLKTWQLYENNHQYVHTSPDNEKLALLWFRHCFDFLIHKAENADNIVLKTSLLVKHDSLLKLFEQFHIRARYIDKPRLFINHIAILFNKTLEHHSYSKDILMYYDMLIKLYEEALKLKSLKTNSKNYLLSGIFYTHLKKILSYEAQTACQEYLKNDYKQSAGVLIGKIFQDVDYNTNIIIQLFNIFEKYKIKTVIEYVQKLCEQKKNYSDDAFSYGSLSDGNLIKEIIHQVEGSLSIAQNIAWNLVTSVTNEELTGMEDLEALYFYKKLLTLTYDCIQGRLNVYNLQACYLEYYDQKNITKITTVLHEILKEVMPLLQKTDRLIIKAKKIVQCSHDKETLAKNNADNLIRECDKEKKKSPKSKATLKNEKIKKLMQKAKSAAKQLQYETAITDFLQAYQLSKPNKSKVIVCLLEIANCYSTLAQNDKEKLTSEANLLKAKEYYQTALDKIKSGSIKDLSSLNAEQQVNEILSKLANIDLQLHLLTEKIKQEIKPETYRLNDANINTYIQNFNIVLNDFEKNVFNILREHGYFVFILGGRVKNAILSLTSNTDTDIIVFNFAKVTEDNLTKILSEKKLQPRIIGKEYAVIRLVHEKSNPIDINDISSKITSFNINWKETPQNIIYEILTQHAKQCSFTIDAIFYCPFNAKFIDPLLGQNDLKAKELKSMLPGIQPELILRAVRFVAKYGMTKPEYLSKPSNETIAVLQKLDKDKLYSEINKLLMNGYAYKSFDILVKADLFKSLFPMTHQCMRQNIIFNKMITQLFVNTDNLNQAKIPLSAAYLYSVLLWGPLAIRLGKEYTPNMFQNYLQDIIESQLAIVNISPNIVTRIKSILGLCFFGFEKLQNELKAIPFQFTDVRLAKQLTTFYDETLYTLEQQQQSHHTAKRF